ncbi:DNA damage-inducible protein DinB [Aliidongia dinghuensis]|uniref:DNA damage-inducible protein DinB n=1 Tax=Aliidongia dinghuensis TaxID=1867774 RepID=A0A8J2YUL5_9PROT|nr:DinB family protein [Aliidongia dinghuensis]GGF23309.1 DNA damage-inducible protein DinB [Aliidongia dinghuensis]
MPNNLLAMLTRYNRWANGLIFEAVAALPEGEAEKPRQTVFSSILRTLDHVYVVGRIFQAHLEGRPHGYEARVSPETPQLGELAAWQRALDDWYVSIGDRLSADGADEPVDFTFVDGGSGRMTRAEILLHVVNHTSYHRGFVADLLRQIPARAPVTDLPVFIRDRSRGAGA